jgi:cytochrome c-type biogenesis protein CcmF
VLRYLRLPAVVALVAGVLFPVLFLPEFKWQAAIGMVLAFWIALVTFKDLQRMMSEGRGVKGIPRSQWGMTIAHLGVAVFTVGVCLTSLYSTEKDIKLSPGESYLMEGYEFVFQGVNPIQGPNYRAERGHLIVRQAESQVADMWPEKRIYTAQPQPMTEAAIDAGLTRDLFVALGEPLGAEGAWALRIYHKPFIRWIWLGCIFMGIGGLLAATDRRYRLQARRAAKIPAGATTEAVG